MSVEPGPGTGHLLGILLLVAAAYGTLAVIGGGLYLAHRRAVRRRVERLIGSLPGAAEAEPARARADVVPKGGTRR